MVKVMKSFFIGALAQLCTMWWTNREEWANICFHGNFQQTPLLISSSPFSYCLCLIYISFNAYIVFYGFTLCSTRETSSASFFFASYSRAFTMLKRNHMCLIFSTISLLLKSRNPLKKNGGICWEQNDAKLFSLSRSLSRFIALP